VGEPVPARAQHGLEDFYGCVLDSRRWVLEDAAGGEPVVVYGRRRGHGAVWRRRAGSGYTQQTGSTEANLGYPPDLQEEAVKTVLMQAELLCADWAVA
jgi:hypothetical protein